MSGPERKPLRVTSPGEFWSGTTAWARRLKTPLREYVRTETGGAALLLAAAVAALVWVNVHASSYEEVWETALSIRLGGEGVELTLREWVNSGLMTFFFLERVISRFRSSDLMGVAEVLEHLARRAEQGLVGA